MVVPVVALPKSRRQKVPDPASGSSRYLKRFEIGPAQEHELVLAKDWKELSRLASL